MAVPPPNHDELFIRPDSNTPIENDTPPPPLRIVKQSATPTNAPQDPYAQPIAQQWAQYRVPPSSAAAQYGAPTSPPPTGPLPYPDERARRQGTPQQRIASRTATPQETLAEEGRGAGPPTSMSNKAGRRSSMASSDASSGAGSGGRRARFTADDPNRPTAAYSPPTMTGATIGRLAERRGTQGKSMNAMVPPDSPGGPEPPYKSDEEDEDEGDGGTLFQIPVKKTATPAPVAAAVSAPEDSFQQYYPPPLGAAPPQPQPQLQQQQSGGGLHIPNPAGINRLDSTASTSTTRASRGSPPPPETPATDTLPPSGLTGIEARYAASGIPGTNTLNEMQAQSAAAAARRAHYAAPIPQRGATPQAPHAGTGRWSPTERPGSAPHGPPITFQGNEEVVQSRGTDVPTQSTGASRPRLESYGSNASNPNTHPAAQQLESDMNRLHMHDEPPPAYSPPVAGTVNSQYPNEKGRYANNASPAGSAAGSVASVKTTATRDPNIQQHPAFANEQAAGATPSPGPSAAAQQNGGMTPVNIAKANQYTSPGPSGAGPASPPPLPEGWIAHLDNNSGQYYYIHLPTQSTQWEFPKGPNPLALQEPMSPVGTFNPTLQSPAAASIAFQKQPLASPGFPIAQTATYPPDHQRLSIASIASPTSTAGFTGPPPSAGVDMYKIAPTNGVYFGPYLRYTNMDIERGLWLGSIMLVCEASQQPPTIHIHQSIDLSPNPRQLKAHPIHSHQRWIFYRYDVDLRMDDQQSAKWTYAITSHLGCTRYEFLVAGRYENSWRFVAHAGNDFAMNVSANERSRLGGIPLMWKDVLLKHQECGGFHTQIGLGGQIYADRLWKDIPALKQWTQMSGKENRKNAPWSAKLDEDVSHAFFHYYTSHFDQPAIREAFAQIPQICCLDDHDIFDGWGSYPEYMQSSHVFRNIGRIGVEMYLLFQHHTTHEILRNVSNDIDLFTITGQGWHFVKYLGPALVVVGPDTRSERNANQVMAGPTYQGLFPKVAVLPPSVQHCLWLFPVPIVYPRLEAVEQVANTVATGKKFVTGGFNMAGKLAGGLAGVVGAKGAVNSGFEGVKKAVGKSGLMQGVLSPFGEIDMLDELRDLWTHESKDLERTYIIRTLQGISHNKSLRMTFLSGSVNVCGAGLVHDPAKPSDHKTMYQLITSSIVNAPTPSYVIKLLHNNKPLFIPQNGHRSTPSVPTDTKEDMMEIFGADVDGRPRELRRLMGRRNYLACVAYDPEMVQGAFGGGGGQNGGGQGQGRLSLAADFMVQNEGAYGQPMKYGPVIIPSLEYGR